MSWLILILAGCFEVVWAIYLKDVSLQNIPVLLIVLVSMTLSVVLLAVAVRTLPIAVAYAIWTSIGIAGTSAYSLLTSNKVSIPEICFIGLILIGIVGLKLFHHS